MTKKNNGSDLPPAVLDGVMNTLCECCDNETEEEFSYLAALTVLMASMDMNARRLMMAFMHSNPTLKAGPDGVWCKIGEIEGTAAQIHQ